MQRERVSAKRCTADPVYNWIGVAFLRRGWINLDLIWIGALLVCGTVLLVDFS